MAKQAQALKAESKRRLKETNSKYKAETDEHRLNKVFKQVPSPFKWRELKQNFNPKTVVKSNGVNNS